MHDLILSSLEIENFRLFRQLRIERLARVNLIVGKNNVGKTALLEALWLYARRGVPAVIRDQITRREEAAVSNYGAITALRHLFTDRPEQLHVGLNLNLGPLHDPLQRLSIGIETASNGASAPANIPPRYVVRYAGQSYLSVELLASIFDIDGLPTLANLHATFLTADGRMNPAYLESLWEQIALTDDEARAVAWLQLLAPDIERISLKSDPSGRAQRVPMVRVRGMSEPIALRSYGDGLVRLFAIAIAALNARNGLLLIDEIENGIHYTVQPDIWRFMFQLAESLNVQVFVTTHSSDCIEAFQMVAEEQHADGQIIRLARKGATLVAICFDGHDLETITRDHIEVR